MIQRLLVPNPGFKLAAAGPFTYVVYMAGLTSARDFEVCIQHDKFILRSEGRFNLVSSISNQYYSGSVTIGFQQT